MKAKKKSSKMTVKNIKKHARASPKQNFPPKKSIEKKTESKTKGKNGKTLLIAQEVKFARLLANNDKRVRDKVLKNLKKWLTVRSQSSFAFTEADFLRLWKGLFYCMWMSDKPLVQEDLAESLSKLVHCFDSMEPALLYTKCTLKSLAAEWFGIDQYRLDKFQMLARKIIRQTFVMCKNKSWNKQWVVGVAKIIEEILIDPKTCLGFNLHITELYMEELAKISEGNISKDMVTELVRPFVIHLASTDDQRQIKHIIKNIFRYLVLQSDVGMDYTEKFNAWRNAGFPCQSIDEMQKVELSDQEDDNEDDDRDEEEEPVPHEKPLDPRAGRVDVEIPQIPFNPAGIAKVLKENKFHKSSTAMTRKQITRLIHDFTDLHKGDMPFGIKEIPLGNLTRVDPHEAAEELLNFEDELYQDSASRRRKKNGDYFEDDDEIQLPFPSDDEIQLPFPSEDEIQLPLPSDDEIQNTFSSDDEEDVPMPKTKKRKVSEIKGSGTILEIQKVSKEKKMKKSSLNKKSKKLNVSELLQKKKVKKSPKKFNNTFTEGAIETKSNVASPAEPSTSLNWSVDENTSPSTSATPKKLVVSKKTPQKNKTSPGKKSVDSSPASANTSWLTPVLTRLEEQNKTPAKSSLKQTPQTGSAKKKVQIMLHRNVSQNTSEYIRQILKSPGIPYDADRKPGAGLLKPSPLPSPINPFYKNKNKNL